MNDVGDLEVLLTARKVSTNGSEIERRNRKDEAFEGTIFNAAGIFKHQHLFLVVYVSKHTLPSASSVLRWLLSIKLFNVFNTKS